MYTWDYRIGESLLRHTEILLQDQINYRTGDMQKKSTETDIYITPDFRGESVIDFDREEAISNKGEEALDCIFGNY